ncbi:TetR family transcriptional regulator C-terminal domain-containing protein [Lutibacter sp.]|uniref:TetR family transcriptional regulator C-terminal domain-containing protein n=1 Tax=Lutibacter sp. TaxID=1925666 RepID=UPI001A2DD986|nr:TetR family transcriptional regulator C-terminal domain-containing protein [Lutibacter sp.]MBI9042398.1 TetR/AcrR family transcriptional regulator [Lutibacter sp.]
MAKKTTITAARIINFYMDYVLEHQKQPASVYAFAKANNFDEALFYTFYANFEAVEKSIFNAFFENTMNVLMQSTDYETYDARAKLLSFYYTFFENLTANRSYVVYALNKHKNSLKNLTTLTALKNSFTAYITTLNIETFEIEHEKIAKIQDKGIKESYWIQLLMTLKFWLDDSSTGFEKTDIFIEKSVNTSFDLMDIKPFKSAIDFGKFLLKEKMNFNI